MEIILLLYINQNITMIILINILLESGIISQKPEKTQYQHDASNPTKSYGAKINFHLKN